MVLSFTIKAMVNDWVRKVVKTKKLSQKEASRIFGDLT